MSTATVRYAGLLLGLGLLLAACATNPVTGRSDLVLMTEEEEIALGRGAHAQIVHQYGGIYDDHDLAAYVQRVGERLGERSHRGDLIYRFTVLDSPMVNAFALPGGYIYITRGLIAYLNSEDELAAVLGHEIGHVTARHSVRQISGARAAEIGYTIGSIFIPELRTQGAHSLFGLLGNVITSGYGREHELEADRLGAEYLDSADYDPQAMIRVIGILKDQEEFERHLAAEQGREPRVYHGVFASHPSNDQRLQEVVASVTLLGQEQKAYVAQDRGAFIRRLNHLVFGESEHEGVLRDGVFLHRDLGIGFAPPKGWQFENLPDRLLMQAPDGEAVLQVGMEDINKRRSPREFLVGRLGLKAIKAGEVISPGGLEGYTGLATIKTPFGKREARVATVFYRRQAYIFVGVSKDKRAMPQYDLVMRGAIGSFHALGGVEAKRARALRLRVTQARAGQAIGDYVAQSALTEYASEQLRLLNGLYPDREPQPGNWLKLVE